MRAKNAIYASGQEPQSVAFLPGAEIVTFIDDDFYYVDFQVSGEADSKNRHQSIGTTYIYHADRLIWFMNYEGWWRVDASGAAAIEFRGGCGSETYTENGELEYQNILGSFHLHQFTMLHGYDVLCKGPQFAVQVSRHYYHGGTTVTLPE